MAVDLDVKETMSSLYGIRPIVDNVLEKVINPLQFLHYGKPKPPDGKERLPPKFILISGPSHCGKSALASAIVNELRRGPLTKRSNGYYSKRNVKFLIWGATKLTMESVDSFKKLIGSLRENSDDMIVLLFQDFHRMCPADEEVIAERFYRRHTGFGRSLHEEYSFRLDVTNALFNEVESTPPGKILVIGTTYRPNDLDGKFLARVEDFMCTFHLTFPDDQARRELFWGFLEDGNATLSKISSSSTFMDQLVDATHSDYSPEDIGSIVKSAITSAQTRVKQSMPKKSLADPLDSSKPIELKPFDFYRWLELDINEDEQNKHENKEANSEHLPYVTPKNVVLDTDPLRARIPVPPGSHLNWIRMCFKQVHEDEDDDDEIGAMLFERW